MSLTRKSRFVTALLALVGMLFMQLAVAAYACPRLQSDETVPAPEAMTDCDSAMTGNSTLDVAAPNLCYEHCNGQLLVDQTQSLQIPALSTSDFLVVPVGFAVTDESRAPRLTLLRARANGPPLAILNCCFRI